MIDVAVKKNRAKKENPTWFDVNEAKRKGVDMGLTFCVTVWCCKSFGKCERGPRKFERLKASSVGRIQDGF